VLFFFAMCVNMCCSISIDRPPLLPHSVWFWKLAEAEADQRPFRLAPQESSVLRRCRSSSHKTYGGASKTFGRDDDEVPHPLTRIRPFAPHSITTTMDAPIHLNRVDTHTTHGSRARMMMIPESDPATAAVRSTGPHTCTTPLTPHDTHRAPTDEAAPATPTPESARRHTHSSSGRGPAGPGGRTGGGGRRSRRRVCDRSTVADLP
jgi:hypothetical protein